MDIILGDLGKGGFEKTGNHTLIMAIAWAILHAYGNYTSAPLVISQYASKRQNHAYQADLIDALMGFLQRRHYRVYIMEEETLFGNGSLSDWGDFSEAAIWFIDSWNSFE